MRRLFAIVCLAGLLSCAFEQAFAQEQTQNNTASQGTAAGGAFRIGGAVSPPRLKYGPDPEYSEDARQAKIQGRCVLWVIVGTDGKPRDIKVVPPVLGHGLDEKAIEAVSTWRFEPGMKDGKPVATMINVEVTFHLYSNLPKKLLQLEQQANAGDPKAELDLAKVYFQGRDVPQDEERGLELLRRSANQGLPEAEFQMGEYGSGHATKSADLIDAYIWFVLAQRGGYKHSNKKLKQLAAKMSPENIDEAKKRAESWQPSK